MLDREWQWPGQPVQIRFFPMDAVSNLGANALHVGNLAVAWDIVDEGTIQFVVPADLVAGKHEIVINSDNASQVIDTIRIPGFEAAYTITPTLRGRAVTLDNADSATILASSNNGLAIVRLGDGRMVEIDSIQDVNSIHSVGRSYRKNVYLLSPGSLRGGRITPLYRWWRRHQSGYVRPCVHVVIWSSSSRRRTSKCV